MNISKTAAVDLTMTKELSYLLVILARPDDTSSRSLAFRPLHHG